MKELVFVAKQAVRLLLYPVGLCLLCLFAGLLLIKRKENSKLGIWLVALAAVWLLITSTPFTSYILIRPLEVMAGPSANPEELKKLGVRNILVLGGGGFGDRRVVEGIRLWRHIPDSRLILSAGRKIEGRFMRELPPQFGVPLSAMHVQAGASDTADEARIFAATLGKAPFALVTSAFHMPRALRLFRAIGLHPVAAPCEYRTFECPSFTNCLLPSADSLLTTQLAIHEYAGLAWLSLTSKVARIFAPTETH